MLTPKPCSCANSKDLKVKKTVKEMGESDSD